MYNYDAEHRTVITVILATFQGVCNYSGVRKWAADASLQKWMASWSPNNQKMKLLSHHVAEPVCSCVGVRPNLPTRGQSNLRDRGRTLPSEVRISVASMSNY